MIAEIERQVGEKYGYSILKDVNSATSIKVLDKATEQREGKEKDEIDQIRQLTHLC